MSFDEMAKRGRPELLQYFETHRDLFKPKELPAIGEIYFDEGKYEQSAEVFREVVSKMTNSVIAWVGLGNSRLAQCRWDEAADSYLMADTLGYEEAVRMLAVCYVQSGKNDKLKEMEGRLFVYIGAREERDSCRQELLGVIAVAACKMEPFDKELFRRCVSLLPKDRSIWRPDVRDEIAKGAKLLGISSEKGVIH